MRGIRHASAVYTLHTIHQRADEGTPLGLFIAAHGKATLEALHTYWTAASALSANIHTAIRKGDGLSQVGAGAPPLTGVVPPLPRYNRKEKSRVCFAISCWPHTMPSLSAVRYSPHRHFRAFQRSLSHSFCYTAPDHAVSCVGPPWKRLSAA